MSDRAPGVIRSDEAYTVAEFRRRAGIGDFAWRGLRRVLPVVCIGRRRFILGADWLQYLQAHKPKSGSGGPCSHCRTKGD